MIFVCLFVCGNIHVLSTLHRLIINRCMQDQNAIKYAMAGAKGFEIRSKAD